MRKPIGRNNNLEIIEIDNEKDGGTRIIALKIYHEMKSGQCCKIYEVGKEVWDLIVQFDRLDNTDEHGTRINKKLNKKYYTQGYVAHKIFGMQERCADGEIYTLIWRVQ